MPQIEGGGGNDRISFVGTTGADDITVSSLTGNAFRVAQAGAASVDARDIETLVIDLGAGADTLTIGSLRGSGIGAVVIDAGQIVTQTGAVILVPDEDDPSIKHEVPVVRSPTTARPTRSRSRATTAPISSRSRARRRASSRSPTRASPRSRCSTRSAPRATAWSSRARAATTRSTRTR